MINKIIGTTIFISSLGFISIAQAENPAHLSQLLSTKRCQNCDLSGTGLVRADLRGADLSGANLAGANLSRANLTGADLSGANLAGAGLFGANLNGTNLTGANVSGTDLRNTYLFNADLTDVSLKNANLQGATGIPLKVVEAEQLYVWGVAAAEKGNQQQAINYFNQAIAAKPKYAAAYLARGISRYQILDGPGALQDAKAAEKLFESEKNQQGTLTAKVLVQKITTPDEPQLNKGKPSFMDFVSSLSSVLLQFIPF
ncbi:MAG: pentapeptide repeat-containing protein [Cyanobacteria bacterium P01_A01_bin.45]